LGRIGAGYEHFQVAQREWIELNGGQIGDHFSIMRDSCVWGSTGFRFG
jgi:hypothetical protein